jgi:hypothetical protein
MWVNVSWCHCMSTWGPPATISHPSSGLQEQQLDTFCWHGPHLGHHGHRTSHGEVHHQTWQWAYTAHQPPLLSVVQCCQCSGNYSALRRAAMIRIGDRWGLKAPLLLFWVADRLLDAKSTWILFEKGRTPLQKCHVHLHMTCSYDVSGNPNLELKNLPQESRDPSLFP